MLNSAKKIFATVFIATLCYAGSSQQLFSMFIQPEQDVVQTRSPVRIKVTMKNKSDRVVSIAETNPADDFIMIVKNAQGASVPLTALGAMLKDKSKRPLAIQQRNFILTLKPGETAEDTVEVSAFCDMTAVGQYKIQLQRALPSELGSGMVSSNVIVVTVTE